MTEKIKDNDNLLNIAWQNWRQEIMVYWQRALYFFGFISIVSVGYVEVKIMLPTQPVFSLLLSMLSMFLAFSWYLSNRGSKFWQENWELHIKELENNKLMGEILHKSIDKTKILSSYPFSPYKINTLISLVIFLFCFACVLYETFSLLGYNNFATKWIAILVIPFVCFIAKIPKMVEFRKFK